MACLNDYDYDILLSHQTYPESEKFILSKYWETYYVEPGYSVLGLRILGSDYVPIAVEDDTDNLILPYTKALHGHLRRAHQARARRGSAHPEELREDDHAQAVA